MRGASSAAHAASEHDNGSESLAGDNSEISQMGAAEHEGAAPKRKSCLRDISDVKQVIATMDGDDGDELQAIRHAAATLIRGKRIEIRALCAKSWGVDWGVRRRDTCGSNRGVEFLH
jgi:hypothetical protein